MESAAGDTTTILFTDIEGSTRLWEQRTRAHVGGARPARRDRASGGRGQPRRRRKDDRRRVVRGLRRSRRWPQCIVDAATIAERSGGHERDSAARALRPSPGRGRTARQRLFRPAREPDGPHHGGGARRANPVVAGGRRQPWLALAGRGHAPRPRRRPAQGSDSARARLPDRAPAAPPGISRRCVRWKRHPTTSRSSSRRSSGASARSPRPKGSSRARVC